MKPIVQVLRTPASNVERLAEAFRRCSADVRLVGPGQLSGRDGAVVIPGVSSFATLARALRPAGDALREAREAGVPILGVCAGFQVLHESSEEGPGRGLGFLPGRVTRLRSPRRPHLGWSRLDPGLPSALSAGLPAGAYAYFAHSYRVPDARGTTVLATRHRAERFPSAATSDRLWGVQFHPELSGAVGRQLLANFVALAREAGP